MMRIITGSARGVRLDTLEGEMTRPTTERAKEAVFSILRARTDLSREAVRVIEKNAAKTRLADRCTILCSDAASYLRSRRGHEAFDCIFLDPPYAMRAVAATVEDILRARLLAPGGLIVCESGEPDPLGFGTGTALSGHFSLLREAKYGKAYITLVTAASATGAGGDES